jgi:hypothetical protein
MSEFLTRYAERTSNIQPTPEDIARAHRNIEIAGNANAEQAKQERLLSSRGPSPEMVAAMKRVDEFSSRMGHRYESTTPTPEPDWKKAEFEIATKDKPLFLKDRSKLKLRHAPRPAFKLTIKEPEEIDETTLESIGPAKKRDPFRAPIGYRGASKPETVSPFEGVDLKSEVMEAMRENKPFGRVTSYDAMPFAGAFQAARDEGLNTFAWKGKQYTTQTKEKIKVQEEKAAARPPALQVGEERITDIADLPRYEDPGFTDALEEQGFSIKEGVTAEGVRPEMSHAVKTVAPIFKKLGIDSSGMVLTSGMRDEGGWSFHETGDAIDIRFRPEQVFPGVTGDELRTKIRGVEQRVVEALGAGWDVDLSSHGTGWHLHIEQETEMARQRLHEHGKKHGIKPGEIRNAASKAKYESFLKGK